MTTATLWEEVSVRVSNQRRASAVVEFALVAVVLGTVVAGMVELARAIIIKDILTDAARKGASIAVAANKTYSDIQNDVDDVLSTDNSLPTTVANGKATLTVSVATWNAAKSTYGADTVVTSSTFAPNQYDKVSVKVSVNASDLPWLFLNYTKGVLESETVVMMKQ
jgi:Flp pilus assembly protein TadG